MKPNLSPLAVVGLVLLAGCAGVPSLSPENSTTTTGEATSDTPTTAPGVTITNQTARERAIVAEERRVRQILNNASNITGMVPGYVEPEATILNRTDHRVRVKVVMTYSYEYGCEHRAGAVDNVKTRTVYLITNESTQLLTIRQGVNLLCPPG